MARRKGFTLIELLVVIAIIALLMSIMMPALSRVKKQARKVACTAQLKQWGLIWKFYCDDNEGYWLSGAGEGAGVWWIRPMLEGRHRIDEKLRCCPQATKSNAAGSSIGSWAYQAWEVPNTAQYNDNGEDYIGSYGPNGWMCNTSSSGGVWGRGPGSDYWRAPDVKGAWNVPLFQGQWWVDAWPRDTDAPPNIVDTAGGAIPDRPNTNEMERVCADRHGGFVNNLFCDFSARPVGLKELWTLKWNKSYNVNGNWTKAGGAVSSDWPKWMRGFKEY